MTHHRELFQPTGIGSCTLKNRISMAPMGPVGYADSFGGFNQRLQDYYVERAKKQRWFDHHGYLLRRYEYRGHPRKRSAMPDKQSACFHSQYL